MGKEVLPAHVLGEGEKSFLSVVPQHARCLTFDLHREICGVVCILFNLMFIWYIVKRGRACKQDDSARGRPGVNDKIG